MTVEPLLLASTSPQRRAILEQLGLPFEVVAPDYVENDPPGMAPAAIVCAHAAGKARSDRARRDGGPVLGVDTAVVVDGRIFGKPRVPDEAHAMLSDLSGREHMVVSGLCLVGAGVEAIGYAVTAVRFRPLSVGDIERYVACGEWQGRAGGYAIQGRGAALVDRIDGDYLNVVGLPVALLVSFLAEHYPGAYGFGRRRNHLQPANG
jgi:septum formation protein